MNEEVKLSLTKFKKASSQLEQVILLESAEGHGLVEKQAFGDSVIQRFEFTYELSWKTIKLYFQELGVDVRFPKECFEKAFQQGIIPASREKEFLDMIKDRNLTSHDYGEELAKQILERIKTRYALAMKNLLGNLEAKIK